MFELSPWLALAFIFWKPLGSLGAMAWAKWKADPVAADQAWDRVKEWALAFWKIIA
jgi:hypothetical protein